MSSAASGFRINLGEVLEDGRDGRMKAVEVEAVKANACRPIALQVVSAKPGQKINDDVVAPHPSWEPREIAERAGGVRVVRRSSHPAIRSIRVGPVGLDRDEVES